MSALRLCGICRFAAAVLVLIMSAAAAPAQELSGRVTRGGLPVPSAEVTVHRVTRTEPGEVGKVTTAPDGRFRLSVPSADPAGFTVYFATAEVDGVRYFGRPLHAGEPMSGYEIQAFDTTSSSAVADSVHIARRDLVFIPEQQGGWEIAEVLRVENRSSHTVVPRSGIPVWGFSIPAGISAFEFGEGAAEAREVVRVGNRVMLNEPLPPGAREIFVRYRILAGASSAMIPVREPTDTLNVFIRQPSRKVTVSGSAQPRLFEAEGERFLRFTEVRPRPEGGVRIDWEVPAAAPVDPRVAALAVTAGVLIAGAWFSTRGRRKIPEGSGPDSDS